MHDALDLRELLVHELQLREASGYEVDGIAAELKGALAVASGPADAALGRLYDDLERVSRTPDWDGREPADLEGSLASLPPARRLALPTGDAEELADRIHGAWLGRCAGCILGKPVEGWTAAQVRSYLALSGADHIADYLPRLDPWPVDQPPMTASWPATTRGNVDGAARDDDIDYPVLALHIMESHGPDFTTADVARELLERMPYGRVYTAERVAYRNLLLGIDPPRTALHRNPYREWIGGLIRADAYGYVSAGDPRRAATLAGRDARLSHAGIGLHGAMWAGALVAECLTGSSVVDAVHTSLDHVPPRSRLSEAVGAVVDAYDGGATWEAATDLIEQRYGHYGWVHVLPNAATIAAAVLWGEGDFMRSVGLVVESGRDTDSTGATVGSVMGALVGASQVPGHLIEPLHDRVHSAVFGFDGIRISELAERTTRVALEFAEVRSVTAPTG